MAYNKTNWENSPSTNTPINDTNLNKIEQGIYDCSVITDTVGDVNNLKTDNKSSVVNAINELKDGEIYSTSEINTGKVWIDGKPIYRKYITFSQANSGNYTYTHNLGIDSVVSCDAFCSVASQTISSHGYRPAPYIVNNTNFCIISQITENTIITQVGQWTDNTFYITLEYTKK